MRATSNPELPADPILRLLAWGRWIRQNRRLAIAVAVCLSLTIAGWAFIANDSGSGFSRAELSKMRDLPLPPPGAGALGVTDSGPLPDDADVRMLEDLRQEAEDAPRPDLLDPGPEGTR